MSELPPPNTQLLVSGSGAIYMQNLAVQGNSIIATNTDGSVNFVPNGKGVIGFGDVGFSNGVISTTVTDLDIVLAPNGNGNVGVGTTSPDTRLQVNGYQTFYDTNLLPAWNTTGNDLVPSKIILGNTFCPQIRTFYPDQGYTDQIDLEFWTSGQNIPTDNMSSRLTIKAQSGNVGIGTSSPAAKLDVSGLIKTDHLSLGIHQYPNVGGQWLTINLNTYDGYVGPNAPDPEGGIIFSNIDANSIFKWGYYMGVVKPSVSDQSTSQRLDIGRTIDVKSQISGGTDGTFIPSVTVFNDNVGIGTTSPASKLDVYKNYSGQPVGTTAALLGGTDSGIEWTGVKILEKGSGLNSSDTYVLNAVVNASSKFVVNGTGNVGIGASSPRTRFQVNSPVDSFYSNTSGQSVEIYGSASETPPVYSVVGSTSTVMINSTDAYARNVGASISLGGRSYQWGGSDQQHTVYARISGVQQPDTDQYYGNFVVETLYQNTGGLREALRIDGNGNVGIGTSSPGAPLHIGKGSDGSTRAILATGSDDGFKIKVVQQSSSNATDAIQGNFGLYYYSTESFVLRFKRGGVANDASMSFYTNGSDKFNFANNGDMSARAYYNTSDDRLKINETNITTGLEVCLKLRPQKYTKKDAINSIDTKQWREESGFIAQEIYYEIPELRHIVFACADANVKENIESSNDPSIDPDYSSWGTSSATVDYNEIIPYTVSAIQEIDRRQTMDNERILELEGELALVKEENNLLKQQLVSILGRLSAAGL